MDVQAELEALRREREEKVQQIAEKRRQVEELRRRRAQRVAQQQQHQEAAAQRGGDDELGRSVDSLVAEILGGGAVEAAALLKIVPPGAAGRAASAAAAGGEAKERDHPRHLQQELKVGVVSLEPQEQEVYARAVQTDVSGDFKGSEELDAKKVPSKQQINVLQQVGKMAEKARLRAVRPDAAVQDSIMTRPRSVQPCTDHQSAHEEAKGVEEAAKELSPEERERIIGHPDFNAFFERATLLVERTLGQQAWDVATDWKTGGDREGAAEGSQDIMKHADDYTEDKWAKNRPVTDVRFSPHRKEMFLAAYGQRVNAAPSDPDGCMLVWNLAMRSRPELTFASPSQVLTAHFHRFDPCLFYGGTYAGGIVLWDARARAAPVLRTPLSGKGHSHPVQALQQVGTQNATNLVSASNDGRLCVWSLAMLNLPQETIDLKNETKNKRDLAVMTLSFPENETNVLYVGAEDGSVCQVHLHGSKVGVTEMYDGHDGPVAGIDMHPHQSDASQHGVDVSFDLALTCSFDWSIRLWMVKQYQAPVLSLDAFEDYVYDAKWHPTHPAVFASVDGEGHVDLWNLNQSIESPVVRCESPNQRRLALNRCHFSADGRRLATGDSEGTLAVYALDRSVAQPRNEDFQQFNERVRQLQPTTQRARDAGGYSYGDARHPPVRGGLDSRH